MHRGELSRKHAAALWRLPHATPPAVVAASVCVVVGGVVERQANGQRETGDGTGAARDGRLARRGASGRRLQLKTNRVAVAAAEGAENGAEGGTVPIESAGNT